MKIRAENKTNKKKLENCVCKTQVMPPFEKGLACDSGCINLPNVQKNRGY